MYRKSMLIYWFNGQSRAFPGAHGNFLEIKVKVGIVRFLNQILKIMLLISADMQLPMCLKQVHNEIKLFENFKLNLYTEKNIYFWQ